MKESQKLTLKEDKSASIMSEDEFKRITLTESYLFCSICLMYPEYSISKETNNAYLLRHTCIKGMIITKPLDFKDKDSNFNFKKYCAFCQKICDKICMRCKVHICESCSEGHDKELYERNIGEGNIRLNSVQSIMDCQYICTNHFLKYEYYCPICKINLCKECIWEHYHIECPQLESQNLEYKLTDKIKISNTNPLVLNLLMVSKAFYYCYKIANENNKLTLNIILNKNLADNILSIVEDDSLSKINEIKNNFLANVDTNLYTCKKYGDSDFTFYYSKLLSSICRGNIKKYHILDKIKNNYKNAKIGFFFWDNSYHLSLMHKIENYRNNYILSKLMTDFNKTKLDFCNCLKIINDLKLESKASKFRMELLKKMCLRMNSKLGLELRRKIANLIGLNIIKMFDANIETIEPSIKLLFFTGEKIKEEIKKINLKNSSVKYTNKNKLEEKLNLLKNNYKTTLELLLNITNKELDNFIQGNNIDNETNILQFKYLNEDEKEIKKAVILNLFFNIRKEMGIEYNDSIHNQTIDICNIIKEEIENTTKEENQKKADNQNKEKTEQFLYDESNEEINNNICKDKYHYLDLIKNTIKIKENIINSNNNIFSYDDSEQIISCTLEKFYNILIELESSYSIAPEISFSNAMNILLDDDKCGILNIIPNFKNRKNILKQCKEISEEEKRKIEKIKESIKDINDRIDDELKIFESQYNNIIFDINDCAKLFDIKYLLRKYKIDEPIDIEKAFNIILNSNYISDEEVAEFYFLTQVIIFFDIKSRIKISKSIKNRIKNLDLEKLMISSVYKEKMVDIFMNDINDFTIGDIGTKVWNVIKRKKHFVDDKKLNNYIIDYANKNNIDDYKKDIINLVSPLVKEINLKGKDPQEIKVLPFMLQQKLLNEIKIPE